MTRFRRLLFWVIALLPMVFVCWISYHIIRDIVRIRAIDPVQTLQALNEYLETKEGRTIPLPPEVFAWKNDRTHIAVFGASSVVVSDGKRFSELLEEQLNRAGKNVTITNFGIPGIDSYTLVTRVQQVLDSAPVKPSLVILYAGHNDFNNAYDAVIKARYPSFDIFLEPLYALSDKHHPRIIAEMTYHYFARMKKPEIIELLQQTGLVELQDSLTDQYNRMIVNRFSRNMEIILSGLNRDSIPVLMVTPIGNLHAPPFGDLEEVTYKFEAGIQSPDPETSFRLLSEARDAEMLTYDIRAKSVLLDEMRRWHSDELRVFDLERYWLQKGYGFDDQAFLDYFHLNESSHQKIARALFNVLTTDSLFRSKLEVSSLAEPAR